MEIGILMGLLGLGLLFGLGGSDDTDEDTDVDQPPVAQPEPEMPAVEPEPEIVGTLVRGTDGDDTLGSEPFDATEVFTILGGEGDDDITYDTFTDEGVREPQGYAIIEGGGGDDRIELVHNSNLTSEVSGGEGNDTIIGNPFALIRGDGGDDRIVLDDNGEQLEATAFDGEGDDTISAFQDNLVYGEDGDDTINITHANLWNGTGLASGGTGDDHITISTNLGSPFLVQEGLLVDGNEGNDTFTFDLDLVDDPEWEEVGANGNTGIIIRDFNPEEDQLVVDVDFGVVEEDSAYNAILTEQSENEYGVVVFVVEDEFVDDTPAPFSTFTIMTTSPITLDDISFISNVPRAA